MFTLEQGSKAVDRHSFLDDERRWNTLLFKIPTFIELLFWLDEASLFFVFSIVILSEVKIIHIFVFVVLVNVKTLKTCPSVSVVRQLRLKTHK